MTNNIHSLQSVVNVGNHSHDWDSHSHQINPESRLVNDAVNAIKHDIDNRLMDIIKITAMNDSRRIIEYVGKRGFDKDHLVKCLEDVDGDVRKEVLSFFEFYG